MSKMLHNSKKGFTLIELMIVVAIIGILAAIAIPNFLRFQLKSKTSEGKVNLAAIRTAEEAYMAEFGNYVAAASTPGDGDSTAKSKFTGGGFTAFNDTLGFAPEGLVYFDYGVTVGSGSTSMNYTADAQADIDGNGTPQSWGYVKVAAGSAVKGAHGCTGVYNGTVSGIENVVGPCGLTFGASEF